MVQTARARLSERPSWPNFLPMKHLRSPRKAAGVLALAAFVLAGCADGVPWQKAGCAGETLTETTLFFGLSRVGGEVTEAEWAAFQKNHLEPAFAEGFTVINGDGYWRVPETGKSVSEKSKILIRVHSGSSDDLAAIAGVINTYKTQFDQESVLRMESEVCTDF